MSEFNLEEWKKQKAREANCIHISYVVALGETTNGNQIRRFSCIDCGGKATSSQLPVSDTQRKIPSKKHDGKTLQEIMAVDKEYVYWVAVKSKMSQPDRYACARMCLGCPYEVPGDGEVILEKDLPGHAGVLARQFIIKNGGKI